MYEIGNNTLQILQSFYPSLFGNIDRILSFFAILIAAFSALYTRKSLKEPTLLTARIKHTEGIKKFLKEWYIKIPVIKAPIYEYNQEDSIGQITKFLNENWEYDDLITHHIPRDLKSFPYEWGTYISNMGNYRDVCNNLFAKIISDIQENIKLEYDPKVSKDRIFTIYFASLIYTQHINWATNKDLFYSAENLCTIDGHNLFHQQHGYLLARGDNLVLAKEFFQKMMLSPECLVKYSNYITEIILIHNRIEENEKKIKYILDLLIGQPLLPGSKCKFLRSAFGWWP